MRRMYYTTCTFSLELLLDLLELVVERLEGGLLCLAVLFDLSRLVVHVVLQLTDQPRQLLFYSQHLDWQFDIVKKNIQRFLSVFVKLISLGMPTSFIVNLGSPMQTLEVPSQKLKVAYFDPHCTGHILLQC